MVVAVGDQVTSHEIIARLCAPDSPARHTGTVYRNMKNIPHINAFGYIMGCTTRYKKIQVKKKTMWRRIE
jgi:hypothetical protein